MEFKLRLTTALIVISFSCFSQIEDKHLIPIYKEEIKTEWSLDFKELNEKFDSLKIELMEIQSILVGGVPAPNSTYMLRANHLKTKQKIESLSIELNEKTKTIGRKKSEIESLRENLEIQITKAAREVEKNENLNKSQTENIKKFEKVVEEYINEGLVSISMTEALLKMDKALNSSKSQKDLLKYKELQTLVINGKSLFKEGFNAETVKNINSSIEKNSNWQSKSPRLFEQLKQLKRDIESYQELLCDINDDIEDKIAANISDDSKKKRIRELTNRFDSDIYRYLHQEVIYASKNLKNRIPQMICN
ncbi:hypothetical protein N9O13_05395 [Crocinitomicaceae bacterium]|nr:hypothetical protein [Crocinitomicaceae bacterium]